MGLILERPTYLILKNNDISVRNAGKLLQLKHRILKLCVQFLMMLSLWWLENALRLFQRKI